MSAWMKPCWVPSYMSAPIFQSIRDACPPLAGDGSGKPEQAPEKPVLTTFVHTGKPLRSCWLPRSGGIWELTSLTSEWWPKRSSQQERERNADRDVRRFCSTQLPGAVHVPTLCLRQAGHPSHSCQPIGKHSRIRYWISHSFNKYLLNHYSCGCHCSWRWGYRGGQGRSHL